MPHLQRVSFDFGGHGTANHQVRFTVVNGRTDHQCKAMACLCMLGLGIKLNPDHVTGIRNTAACGKLKAFFPTGLPKLTLCALPPGALPLG